MKIVKISETSKIVKFTKVAKIIKIAEAAKIDAATKVAKITKAAKTAALAATLVVAAFSPPAFAEASEKSDGEKSRGIGAWNFSITADLAYYPEADYVSGGTHFAPTTGIYDGLEFRATANLKQTLAIPFGENPLVKGNTLAFNYGLELSPVSIMPKFSVAFTPVAFLVFEAGADIGTGWQISFMGVQGMAKLKNPNEKKGADAYEDLTAFNNHYVDFYAGATFQFDAAAFWPGDWHHIVFLAGYETRYVALTGLRDKAVWKWQGTGNQVNGWKYDANFVLGWQMPLALSLVGVNVELDGYYSDGVFANGRYNGNFMRVQIAPLARFRFGGHHALTVIAAFATRRSFAEPHEHENNETLLTYDGSEWYFRRVAFSYTWSY